jgi:hypothetical protein
MEEKKWDGTITGLVSSFLPQINISNTSKEKIMNELTELDKGLKKEKIKLIELHFNYNEDSSFESVNVKFLYDGKEEFNIIKSPRELTIDEIKYMLIEHYN